MPVPPSKSPAKLGPDDFPIPSVQSTFSHNARCINKGGSLVPVSMFVTNGMLCSGPRLRKWLCDSDGMGKQATGGGAGSSSGPHQLCSPKYLLAKGVLLLRAETGRWKTRWLQSLLDPHAQEAEAVFVQGEQDVGKTVHEATGGLAPDGLRKRGSQCTRACLLCSKNSICFTVGT